MRVPEAIPASEFPPPPLSLAGGAIHLWRAELDDPPPGGDRTGLDTLSADERARADKIAGTRGRLRFVRSRALLRILLAGYYGRPAADLRLETGPEGKPYLVDEIGRPHCDLRFNLSHAGPMWLLAVRRDAEVGVDVERVDRRSDVSGVARRMFAPGEREVLARLDPEQARVAFFRVWSAREALVKCLGVGMFSLDEMFEIEADPERPLTVRPLAPSGAGPSPGPGASAWLSEIPLEAGWGGVLASRIVPTRVEFRIVPMGSKSNDFDPPA